MKGTSTVTLAHAAALARSLADLLARLYAEEAPATPTRPASRPSGVRLSRQQRAVGRLLVQGLHDREIAHTLSLSINTVRGHLARLSQKLRAVGRVQCAVAVAPHIENARSFLTDCGPPSAARK